jgi:antitoxin component YwqK of YwqJK toxin-antitoxin module
MNKNEEVEVEYYENGNKSYECTDFKDGGSVETEWFEDGTIGREVRCSKGVGLHEIIYYVNGKKHSEKHFQEDGSGVETYYFEDGTKRCEGHYKEGKIVRVLCWWIEKDGKRRHAHYKDQFFVKVEEPSGTWFATLED